MSFITIINPRFAVNSPASTDLFSDIVSDLNYLFTNQNAPSVSGGLPNVVNGSFELDANNTIQPTGWIFNAGTGGSGNVTTGQYNDGSQSYLIVQGNTAGNTGGTLVSPYNQSTLSQQYYVVSPSKKYTFQFMYMCNRADIANIASIQWYSNTQSFISTTNYLVQGTGNAPTSWQNLSYVATPPSNAYYCVLNFFLGQNGGSPPGATGNIWLDGVSLSEYNPCQSGSAYTSGNNTFTVPSGIYTLKVTAVSAGGISGHTPISPNSCLGFMSVIPGDTITINFGFQLIGSTYYSVFAYNTRSGAIISATSGGTANQFNGNPTGGYLNVAGYGLLSTGSSIVTLEY